MTVSHRLTYDFILKSRKLAQKLLLAKSMKAVRLAFAKAHEHRTTKSWNKVLFSDESTIQQFAPKKQNVRRPKGKRCNAKYTI